MILAAILAGGASRRMGADKATLAVDGVAMARRVADAARSGGCAAVVVIGGDASGLAAWGLDVVADAHPGAGPLGGIATVAALLATGELAGLADVTGEVEGVVVLACDLPWLDGATVAGVLGVAADHPEAMVVAAQTGAEAVGDEVHRGRGPDPGSGRREPEPLCALWRQAALDAAAASFAAGARAPRTVLAALSATPGRVIAHPVRAVAVRNANAPEDLGR